MEKLIHVFAAPPAYSLDTSSLLERLNDAVVPHVRGLTAHVRNLQLPREFLASGAFDPDVAFALSVWVDRYEEAAAIPGMVEGYGSCEGTYLVSESVLREYPRIAWPLATRSPGVTLLARLRRRPSLDETQFHRLWSAHGTLSLQMHPLIRYHRNVVVRRCSPAGALWDGIVEERVGDIENLRPERFYGSDAQRDAAVRDLEGFVDLAGGGIRCALLEEYILRSPPWLGN